MFGKRKQKQPEFDLRQFNAELTTLIARAIESRVHAVDIQRSLEDSAERAAFHWAQRPVL